MTNSNSPHRATGHHKRKHACNTNTHVNYATVVGMHTATTRISRLTYIHACLCRLTHKQVVLLRVNPQLAAGQQACRSLCNTYLHKYLATLHQCQYMKLRHKKTTLPRPKALAAATNTQQTRSKHTITPKGDLNRATVSVHNNNAAPTTQCPWRTHVQCKYNLGVGRVRLLQSRHKSTPQCHLPTAFYRCWLCRMWAPKPPPLQHITTVHTF